MAEGWARLGLRAETLGLEPAGRRGVRFFCTAPRVPLPVAPDRPTRDNPERLSPVLERNIEALRRRLQEDLSAVGWQERLAERITAFAGSMPFVYLHVLAIGLWIVVNGGWIPGLPVWDPSYVILAMIASVEAIFLTTFVLIAQNRMTAAAEKRAELDLHVSLLTEHELTKLATVLAAIAARLEVRTEVDSEVAEIERDVAPEAVLDRLEESTSSG
jgi:uncharacterized membrane protein